MLSTPTHPVSAPLKRKRTDDTHSTHSVHDKLQDAPEKYLFPMHNPGFNSRFPTTIPVDSVIKKMCVPLSALREVVQMVYMQGGMPQAQFETLSTTCAELAVCIKSAGEDQKTAINTARNSVHAVFRALSPHIARDKERIRDLTERLRISKEDAEQANAKVQELKAEAAKAVEAVESVEAVEEACAPTARASPRLTARSQEAPAPATKRARPTRASAPLPLLPVKSRYVGSIPIGWMPEASNVSTSAA